MVWFEITHSVLPLRTEKQFDESINVGNLKDKLYLITGTSSGNMQLQLFDQQDKLIAGDMRDEMSLSQYNVTDRMRLHVVDNDPNNSLANTFSNDGSVEKYTISEEAYNSRDDTFRKWKQQNLSQYTAENEEKKKQEEQEHEKLITGIKVGDRCLIISSESRGEVKYVGKAPAVGSGYWIGVQLDEPVGQHNGTVKGKKFFECPDKRGTFVKPDKVKVGDYPEESFDFGSDDEL